MHGERNILHRFVFPELKRRARYLNVDLFPIDLRWGIDSSNRTGSNFFGSVINTNTMVQESVFHRQQVEACLDEIDRSNIFVGILGERYGWKPKLKDHITSKLQF